MLTDHGSDVEGSAPPHKLGVVHRVLLALPRLRTASEKPPLSERMRTTFLKPVEPDAAKAAPESLSVDELEEASRSANDKERLVGLLAAPFAAVIGILVINTLIADDPPALLKGGATNKLHVSLSLYHDLALVLLGLSVAMLVTAWFRKRLYLGMVMALYGLAIFNLHYWGFGIPFILFAAWYLVRAYRLQRDLREANGTSRFARGGAAAAGAARPSANKRYTPPVPAKRAPGLKGSKA